MKPENSDRRDIGTNLNNWAGLGECLRQDYSLDTYNQFGQDGKYHTVLKKEGAEDREFAFDRSLGLLSEQKERREQQLLAHVEQQLSKAPSEQQED